MAQEMAQERRQAVRYQVNLDAVVIAAGTPHISFPAKLIDISIGGFRIQTPKDILPGVGIALFLRLDEEILLRGTVVWLMEEYISGKLAYLIGCQTMGLRPEEEALNIRGLLSKIKNMA